MPDILRAKSMEKIDRVVATLVFALPGFFDNLILGVKSIVGSPGYPALTALSGWITWKLLRAARKRLSIKHTFIIGIASGLLSSAFFPLGFAIGVPIDEGIKDIFYLALGYTTIEGIAVFTLLSLGLVAYNVVFHTAAAFTARYVVGKIGIRLIERSRD